MTSRHEAITFVDHSTIGSVTGEQKELLEFTKIPPVQLMKIGGRQSLPVTGNGFVNFGIDGMKDTIFYMLGYHKNLLSIRNLANRGLYCMFAKKHVFVLNTKKKLLGHGSQNKHTSLYSLLVQAQNLNTETTNLCQLGTNTSLSIWHQCLGHLNFKSIRFMSLKKVAEGLLASFLACLESCHDCMQRKQTKERALCSSKNRYQIPFDLIHSNVYGPIQTPSLAGARYILTFIDDYSRYCWVYFFFFKKHEVFARF